MPLKGCCALAGMAQKRPSMRGTNRNMTHVSGRPSSSRRVAIRSGRTGVSASLGRWTRASAAVSSHVTSSTHAKRANDCSYSSAASPRK